MRGLLSVVVFIAVGATSDSKCAFVPYTVSGLVVDCQNGHPVAGAKILCFLNGEGETWSTNYLGPSELVSDREGRFNGTYRFHTYSGQGDENHPDLCDRRLANVTVVVSLIRYDTGRQVAAGGQITPVQNGGGTVQVPTVRLMREGTICPVS